MPNTQSIILKGVFLSIYRLLYSLKGILPLFIIVGNLSFWIGPLFFLALLKLMIPIQKIRAYTYGIMTRIYVMAAWTDDQLLWRIMGIQLEVRGLEHLHPNRLYLVLANHQSWADILIQRSLFSFKNHIPKFIAKKQVLYLPLVGLICWAYEYPIVKRHSKKEIQARPDLRGKDRKALQSSLKRFYQTPGSIVNFAEGTRYSPSKAKRFQSPYRFLLSPKIGGIFVILQSMGDQLHEILDLTLAYDCPKLSFWDFLSGKCRRVIVQVKHIDPDQAFEREKHNLKNVSLTEVDKWIQQVWEKKDQAYLELRSELNQDRLDRHARHG